MLAMVRKAVDGIRVYHARKSAEREAARRQARLDKVSKQLVEVRSYAGLLDEAGRDGLSGFDSVSLETLEAAEAFVGAPAMQRTVAVGRSLGEVGTFAQDMAGGLLLSFQAEEFARDFGFSAMREAGHFLQSPNTAMELSIASSLRGAAGAMATSSALIRGGISSYREGMIKGTACSLTFFRSAATMNAAEKQALAVLKALALQRAIAQSDFRGGTYSVIYNGGACDDQFSNQGLAVQVSQDQLLGRTIGHRMIAQRVAPVERTLRFAAEQMDKLDPRYVSVIETHLGPLPR